MILSLSNEGLYIKSKIHHVFSIPRLSTHPCTLKNDHHYLITTSQFLNLPCLMLQLHRPLCSSSDSWKCFELGNGKTNLQLICLHLKLKLDQPYCYLHWLPVHPWKGLPIHCFPNCSIPLLNILSSSFLMNLLPLYSLSYPSKKQASNCQIYDTLLKGDVEWKPFGP